MKIRNWNENEINYLKENNAIMTTVELAKKLDKTRSTVEYAARKLGLIKQVHNKWTEEQIQFLKDNYPAMSAETISKKTNHTIAAVNTKLGQLGLTKDPVWSQEEIDYLLNNWETTAYSIISKKINRSEGAIRAKCFELNLIKKDRWTDEEEEYLKKVYREIPIREIAEILGRTPDSVQNHANKMGMKKSPYSCNYRFFEEIDTEEKAYWLGFLSADGWVNKNEETNSGTIGIELQYGDIDHLKKFNKSLSGNYQITDRWRKNTFPNGNTKTTHNCVIRIYSIYMYNDLHNLGFDGNKTYTFEMPKIPDDLIRHYMRGYFDGDGCFAISYNKSGKVNSYSCSYLGASQKIIEKFENIIHDLGIESTRMDTYQRDGYARMWRVWINDGDNQGRLKFLNYLYEDATIYLDRKYEKYKIIKNYIESRGPHQTEMSGSF